MFHFVFYLRLSGSTDVVEGGAAGVSSDFDLITTLVFKHLRRFFFYQTIKPWFCYFLSMSRETFCIWRRSRIKSSCKSKQEFYLNPPVRVNKGLMNHINVFFNDLIKKGGIKIQSLVGLMLWVVFPFEENLFLSQQHPLVAMEVNYS